MLLIALLPETRWVRTREELSGHPAEPLPAGRDRPAFDPVRHAPRTARTDLAMFHLGFHWRAAARSLVDTLRTTLFPAVLWSVLANSGFVVVNQAAAQVTSFALLAQGWEFQYTGLSVLPFVLAAPLVYVLAGPLADRVALLATRRNGGTREPEHHLPNLVLPFALGVGGAFLMGAAGQGNLHWTALMAGWLLVISAFLAATTVLNVYVVESYPMWAGPVLVNASSLRLLVAFGLASQATLWVLTLGFQRTFALYGWALLGISAGIPLLYLFGKRLRRWTAGRVTAPRGGDVLVAEAGAGDGGVRVGKGKTMGEGGVEDPAGSASMPPSSRGERREEGQEEEAKAKNEDVMSSGNPVEAEAEKKAWTIEDDEKSEIAIGIDEGEIWLKATASQ